MSAARRKPPRWSGHLYVEIAPERMAMFRFLLEARDNLAFFTVLDRRRALVRVVFSPCQQAEVEAALTEMSIDVPFTITRPPLGAPDDTTCGPHELLG